MRQYYVYIMANAGRMLYTGITNSLEWRVYQHKHKLVKGYTAKYGITRLVYFEVFDDPRTAIAREKQIKGWLRAKKVALIRALNPTWQDLSAEWFETTCPLAGSEPDAAKRGEGAVRREVDESSA